MTSGKCVSSFYATYLKHHVLLLKCTIREPLFNVTIFT